MKKYIIYHNNCMDGFTAVSFFKMYVNKNLFEEKNEYEYIPGSYSKKFEDYPDFSDSIVFFLDFSFKKDDMRLLVSKAHSVIVIDHHAPIVQELEEFHTKSNFKLIFDNNECGSTLTWKYLYPNVPVPLILQHIRDQDIWVWENKDSEAYLSYLSSLEYSFDGFYEHYVASTIGTDFRLQTIYEDQLRLGRILLKQKYTFTDSIVSSGLRTITLDGKQVKVVNSPPMFIGEIKKRLIDNGEDNLLIIHSDTPSGKRISVRSREGHSAYDIAKLIEPIKGGGHICASGAFIPYSDFSTNPFTKTLYSL